MGICYELVVSVLNYVLLNLVFTSPSLAQRDAIAVVKIKRQNEHEGKNQTSLMKNSTDGAENTTEASHKMKTTTNHNNLCTFPLFELICIEFDATEMRRLNWALAHELNTL